nr:putative cytosolic iron-sulfur protein assembly protein CIAO1 [Cryptomonas curvata]
MMPGFVRLKTFDKHLATIWTISWSSFGELLFSCGADGTIFIWGPICQSIYRNINSKKTMEKLKFSKWNNLCRFESFLDFKTFRNITYSFNASQFCASSFSGISQLCKISFFNGKKFVTLKKKNILIGPVSEIKSCNYSPDKNYICISSRNKTIWVWEKDLKNNYKFFIIIKENDGDIKCTKWYPRHKYLVTSSYGGIINFYKKKKKNLFYNGSIFISNTIIWNINFNEDGKEFYYSTNQGEVSGFLKTKKLYYYLICSTISIPFFLWSNYTSSIVCTNNEESSNILFRCKFLLKKKNLQFFFGGVSKFFRIKFEKSLVCPHIGDINSLAWHPNNNNIIASCGDDLTIYIWHYTQGELFF